MEDLTVGGETNCPPRLARTDLWIGLGLLLATLAAYSSVARFGFIGFDDPLYVVENSHLRDGITLASLRWIFFSLNPDYWFPLTRISLMLDYHLFGVQAGGYHIENVLIHSAAAIALFGFLLRATKQRWPAAFVAFVFALHPLHVESVAWVSERKDVLCAFFWFATLWAWVRYTEQPTRRHYAAALGLFCLGLMAKPMIVTLPFVLVLLDWWPLRREFSRQNWLEKLPFAALSCTLMGLTLLAQSEAGAMSFHPPLFLKLENALVSVVLYIGQTVWPAGLSVIYSYPVSIPVWKPLVSLAGVAGVSALILRNRSRFPYLAVGWGWFLATLLPVIGLVQVGVQARTDHHMYVPMVGLAIMAAFGLAEFVRAKPSARQWVAAAGGAVCIAMAAMTWIQTQYWRDTGVLFRRAVALDGANYVAWDHMGAMMIDSTAFPDEVISCYRNALRIRPDFTFTRDALARYLMKLGRVDDAIVEYQEVLRQLPDNARAHLNVASALMMAGRNMEASAECDAALKIGTQAEAAHSCLGLALTRIPGRFSEGIGHLEEAVRLAPDDATEQYNLGRLLIQMPDRQAEAIDHLQQSLRLNPRNVAAQLSLGGVLLKLPGRRKEAFEHLEEALRLAPDPEKRKRLDALEKQPVDDTAESSGMEKDGFTQ